MIPEPRDPGAPHDAAARDAHRPERAAGADALMVDAEGHIPGRKYCRVCAKPTCAEIVTDHQGERRQCRDCKLDYDREELHKPLVLIIDLLTVQLNPLVVRSELSVNLVGRPRRIGN